MSSVVYLKALADPSITPCLALVDLQQEYIAGPRLMAIPQANAALDKCQMALYHAKTMGFPVAYFRQVCRSSFFNPATTFSGWIKGFEPTGADMIFDRDKPSCYSNKSFAALMDSCGGHFVLAGFAGETACLSTVVDAFHRNHHFTYLSDASASHELGHFSALNVQQAVAEISRVYGEVLDTNSWINATSDIVAVSRDSSDEPR
jgi:nicotinamidase-related amidase